MSPRYPDFKHKKPWEGLWLGDQQKSPWMEAKIAALAPGTVQWDSFSWNRRLVKHVKGRQHNKTINLS
jgi:hypothetical protein